MSVDTLIRKALDAGVELELVDGVIKVIGHRGKVQEWRDRLRTYKAEIFRHLSAANDPETTDPDAIRALAAEYHAHHFNCKTCCGAGQGRGLRCGTGTALWSAYQSEVQL